MKILTLFLLVFFCLPLGAMAQDVKPDYIKAQLISGSQGTGELTELLMALDITLKDQWYTYWRMPGDNGVAPRFDWTGSKNVKDIVVSWPTPKRFTMFDMNSFGYDGNVLFPLTVTPEQPGKEIVLNLKLDIMVCHDICIPQTVTMMRIFGAGDPVETDHAARIVAIQKSLPERANITDFGIDTAILGKDAVVVTAYGNESFGAGTDLIIETPNGLLTGIPEIIPPAEAGGKTILKVKGPAGKDLTADLFGKSVNIILINGPRAIQKTVSF